MRRVLRVVVVFSVLLSISLLFRSPNLSAAPLPDGLWREINPATLQAGERLVQPDQFRAFALDVAALRALLAQAPLEHPGLLRQTTSTLALPLPDGRRQQFRIVQAPIMEAGLAAKYPAITTYLGQGIDDPTASVRLDFTPAGFHALILGSADEVFIDPYQANDLSHYVVYSKAHVGLTAQDRADRAAEVFEAAQIMPWQPSSRAARPAATGDQLRTYRLALAATGEYTAFHGGTVAGALAAMVTTMNRVVGIFEREVGVRMVLINNTDQLIYTNADTDPYHNDDGQTLLAENQLTVDNTIGTANYDIGHVFSTGGGGIAYTPSVCNPQIKAGGVTGSSSPVGDAFDVDYVAHEMGHQLSAQHTFNGTTTSCATRSALSAYEPGSGTTIMAYAGICGAENVQMNSNDYYHARSYDQITSYITAANGGASCGTLTDTGNSGPTVNAGASYTIPAQTPFTLTGSATDPNGDALTYNWEEFDLGTAAPPATDDGSRPLFRSFSPVSSPSRTFPRLSDILSNTPTYGELLPTTNRTMTFRLNARDGRAGGGGVGFATTTVNVVNTGSAFAVTAPNSAQSLTGFAPLTVEWNVAGSNTGGIDCAQVNILFSADGGQTFPTTVLAGAPNVGTAIVAVPNQSTTQGRFKVACATSIFFDISDADLTITGGIEPTPTTAPEPTATTAPTPTTEPLPTPTPVIFTPDFFVFMPVLQR